LENAFEQRLLQFLSSEQVSDLTVEQRRIPRQQLPSELVALLASVVTEFNSEWAFTNAIESVRNEQFAVTNLINEAKLRLRVSKRYDPKPCPDCGGASKVEDMARQMSESEEFVQLTVVRVLKCTACLRKRKESETFNLDLRDIPT
jgi:hypothetical protein